MTIVDVYADRRAIESVNDTWGHLQANPHTRYHGTIVFAHSAYGGDLVVVSAEFKGLADSPWLYEHMEDFVAASETEPGNVYRWSGTYQATKARGPEFKGTTVKVEV